jgi:RND family efflux transporter MFP subunit
VAQASWDQARTRAESARAQYDAALNGAQQSWAALAAAQAQAGLAQKGMADAVIRAPFDGAIAERRITAGEYCQTGRVVAVLVRDSPLRLRFDVPEGDAGRMALGQDVILAVAAFPGRVFHGTIKRVGASLKAQSRTLPVEAEVPNDAQELRPGFFGHAEVVLGGAPVPALLVPRSAVGETGTASRVFVKVAGRVAERIVTLGRELDGLVVVHGTLNTADDVAVDGVEKLSDGAEITALP